jgi:LPXTG-site transpeptidase (sortase) family protein
MFQTIFDKISEQKGTFFGTFFVVFLISYLFLVAIDFVPERENVGGIESVQMDVADTSNTELATTTAPVKDAFSYSLGATHDPVMPESVYIKRLDKRVRVSNPTSNTVGALDAALLDGVVRHPDSADLAEDGNVFILGHSSYLPNVVNKNFQAFNGIQNLEWGDIIEVTSAGYVHIYEVEKVYKASAVDATVAIEGTGPRLTLATCNSFGSKDDRFIVEAKRVEVRPL